MHFAAFVMNTTGHIIQGTWRRPTARQADFNDLEHWVGLARTLERGKFDAIFFADVVGLYAPYRGDERKYFEAGLQVPSNDPSVLASAIAYTTEHLGIAFTASILQEHPFNFARRISTLDHASKGRIAWNIVTNCLPNASRNFGLEGLTSHDERYAWADEYVDVTYKLWEGSWQEDALVQDRVTGIHADFDKVHKINHEGPRYKVEGPHLVSPTPQRTPLLFQAGASEAAAPSQPRTLRRSSSSRRTWTRPHGTPPTSALERPGTAASPRTSSSSRDCTSSPVPPRPRPGVRQPNLTSGSTTTASYRTCRAPSASPRPATLRDVAHYTATNSRIVGTPEQIADALARWQAVGVDGVNLVNAEIPGSYEEFVEHVAPVLQRRGLMQQEYAQGSFRHKLFGRGDRLPERHPAARYRGAFAPQPA
jgi:alkanesulfonate monooxygenase SsuD/methylene tetrahydromethanopterin reductase-like flavin-dependent oxidoreductase (luciferase family)